QVMTILGNRAVLFAAAVLTVTACNGTREPADAQPAIELTRLSTGDVPFTVSSGYQVATNAVIRDSAEWASAWSTLHQGLTPVPPIPAIDFGREMVVLVAIGEQPNGGHSVIITSVRPDGEAGLLVQVEHRAAGPGCMVPQVITAPADLV